MAKTATTKLTVPGVLAFERKLSPSDGRMYSTSWDERESGKHEPLSIIEKSVRGTISNRLKKGKSTDTAKIDAEMQKPNLQSVDVCSLPEHHDTLVLRFTLKIVSGIGDATACNDADFQSSLREQVTSYLKATGAEQLGLRYATNLANARFLWRNRVGAENVAVAVKTLAGLDSETAFQFDSLNLGLTDFDHNDADVETLGKMISATLRGETDFLLLSVTAYAQLGVGQEVFPSQEIMQNSPSGKGEKSKYLYSVDGIAGMHSQKIGNALRTIDTWYDGEAERPIAVESYGSVTTEGTAYRDGTAGHPHFYKLFDQWSTGGEIDTDQQHYVMAMLVRGGVFGKSEKEG